EAAAIGVVRADGDGDAGIDLERRDEPLREVTERERHRVVGAVRQRERTQEIRLGLEPAAVQILDALVVEAREPRLEPAAARPQHVADVEERVADTGAVEEAERGVELLAV